MPTPISRSAAASPSRPPMRSSMVALVQEPMTTSVSSGCSACPIQRPLSASRTGPGSSERYARPTGSATVSRASAPAIASGSASRGEAWGAMPRGYPCRGSRITVHPKVQQDGTWRMESGGILEVTEHELDGGRRLIDLRGEFDVGTAQLVRRALADADDAGCLRVVVDLTEVPVIDSTALAVLVVAHKRLRRTGREMVVVLPLSGMTTKFEIAGLDRFLAISHSRDEALAP